MQKVIFPFWSRKFIFQSKINVIKKKLLAHTYFLFWFFILKRIYLSINNLLQTCQLLTKNTYNTLKIKLTILSTIFIPPVFLSWDWPVFVADIYKTGGWHGMMATLQHALFFFFRSSTLEDVKERKRIIKIRDLNPDPLDAKLRLWPFKISNFLWEFLFFQFCGEFQMLGHKWRKWLWLHLAFYFFKFCPPLPSQHVFKTVEFKEEGQGVSLLGPCYQAFSYINKNFNFFYIQLHFFPLAL